MENIKTVEKTMTVCGLKCPVQQAATLADAIKAAGGEAELLARHNSYAHNNTSQAPAQKLVLAEVAKATGVAQNNTERATDYVERALASKLPGGEDKEANAKALAALTATIEANIAAAAKAAGLATLYAPSEHRGPGESATPAKCYMDRAMAYIEGKSTEHRVAGKTVVYKHDIKVLNGWMKQALGVTYTPKPGLAANDPENVKALARLIKTYKEATAA